VYKRQLLITKRGLGKRFDPGKYIFLGEHMTTGETYEQGVIRGVKEEIGLNIKTFFDIGNHKFSLPEQTELVHFFVIRYDGKEKLKYDSFEILEELWMTPDEIINSQLDLGGMTKTWLEILKEVDLKSLK
jgi:NADH pyrophosphatase NudC (nudix superfamily)